MGSMDGKVKTTEAKPDWRESDLGSDLPPANPASPEYWESVQPQHVKDAIAKRKADLAA